MIKSFKIMWLETKNFHDLKIPVLNFFNSHTHTVPIIAQNSHFLAKNESKFNNDRLRCDLAIIIFSRLPEFKISMIFDQWSMIMTKKPEIIESSKIIMKIALSLRSIHFTFLNLKSENKIFDVWTFNFLIFF